MKMNKTMSISNQQTAASDAGTNASTIANSDPFLFALGERVRSLRARRGLTRKMLATGAHVSERHLASLEAGQGNASAQILKAVADALNVDVGDLFARDDESSAEWVLLRELLRGRSETELAAVREMITAKLGTTERSALRRNRIALIGLRGAGKSSLGRALAEKINAPFVELNREIERLAGCSLAEVHALYGSNAYHRYERRALEETLKAHHNVVIATPGGIVSEPSTFNYLLAHCYAVWLKATPEDHMNRVIAQGDTRPMGANASARREAMADLKRILASRVALYAKADATLDTSGTTVGKTLAALKKLVS
jgi:XRE family transcriptional regulator, aerobic/anaerobic benzoate catabolism transcriptional regulator